MAEVKLPMTYPEAGRKAGEAHVAGKDEELKAIRAKIEDESGWTAYHQMGFDDVLREAAQEGRGRPSDDEDDKPARSRAHAK